MLNTYKQPYLQATEESACAGVTDAHAARAGGWTRFFRRGGECRLLGSIDDLGTLLVFDSSGGAGEEESGGSVWTTACCCSG
ncbi:hypothetical protein INR49_026611 [Caranx melampygus]|nr:hypothetical protein INR49_026611 [Caranx melampygus]